MNLKQLEAFVRVAETKSFSKAAKQLYLTQPTVSAHIASLERELSTCLLVRNTKEVSLTESGKELYAYAGQMLELEQKICRRFGQAVRSGRKVCWQRAPHCGIHDPGAVSSAGHYGPVLQRIPEGTAEAF